MFNEFYMKRTIEKEAVHDADLELCAIQKARESDWDTFKANKAFIDTFKKEHRISSRRCNKIIIQTKSNKNICSLNGMYTFIGSLSTCSLSRREESCKNKLFACLYVRRGSKEHEGWPERNPRLFLIGHSTNKVFWHCGFNQ